MHVCLSMCELCTRHMFHKSACGRGKRMLPRVTAEQMRAQNALGCALHGVRAVRAVRVTHAPVPEIRARTHEKNRVSQACRVTLDVHHEPAPHRQTSATGAWRMC
jgi:hypothetical protein